MVDELREQCKDVLEPEHDDLWLLRYVLSRKTLEKAEPAIRKGIEYRKANKEWLDKAKDPLGKAPYADQIERFTAVDLHKTNVHGGAVMIIRAGCTPVKQLMVSCFFLLSFLCFRHLFRHFFLRKWPLFRSSPIGSCLKRLLLFNNH